MRDNVTFEQAATVPMVVLMAAFGFLRMVKIVLGPLSTASRRTPFLIYGAGSAMAAPIVQYAKMVEMHSLICNTKRSGELGQKMSK